MHIDPKWIILVGGGLVTVTTLCSYIYMGIFSILSKDETANVLSILAFVVGFFHLFLVLVAVLGTLLIRNNVGAGLVPLISGGVGLTATILSYNDITFLIFLPFAIGYALIVVGGILTMFVGSTQ